MYMMMCKAISYFRYNMGRCPYCIRKAFMAAASAWALFAICFLMNCAQSVMLVTGATAVILTGLWITHLLVFAGRASVTPSGTGHSVPRREAFSGFGRALIMVMVASSAPSLARAQDSRTQCHAICAANMNACYRRTRLGSREHDECGNAYNDCMSVCDA